MAGLVADLKVRVSAETKLALTRLAEEAGEGVKVADIARQAIQEYLKRQKALEASEPQAPLTADNILRD